MKPVGERVRGRSTNNSLFPKIETFLSSVYAKRESRVESSSDVLARGSTENGEHMLACTNQKLVLISLP